jgi:peptidoglycan/xylan/chitin deacetylase (PgdA/CDA1 family)
MYHSVSASSHDPWRLHVTPQAFETQLRVLRERYRPLALRELGARLAAGEVPPRSVVVTFDDGYRDNLDVAAPLLASFELPATVFVTTGYLGLARDFWWEELAEVCALAGIDPRERWERLRGLDRREREGELDGLWAVAGRERPEPSTALTPAEVARLAAAAGIEIGAHTRTHPHLSTLTEAEQLEEIDGSRRELEAALGEPVTSFSYPHGDFSPATKRLVGAAGLTLACTTAPGAVSSLSDPLELPRVRALSWDADAFARELDLRLAR